MRLDDTYLRVGKIENTSFGTTPVHPVRSHFEQDKTAWLFFLVNIPVSTRTTYDTRLASIYSNVRELYIAVHIMSYEKSRGSTIIDGAKYWSQ